jgi:Flp pilus assembly protein TadD
LLPVLAVYAQVVGFDFVNFDDLRYVSDNPRVLSGLSPENLVWALTATTEANWHPLTWLSLMLDTELGGPGPAVYHATNLALHVANTLLLFLLLSRMTGSTWRSAFVALLFGIHPLHVESVAWVTERKDVLSTLFWLLTLLAYVRYAGSPRLRRYLLVLLTFALGLMAKPMLVSLPLVLLLLDYWPLARLSRRSLWEKLPLLALAAASSVITLHAQSAGGGLNSLEALPVGNRVANALTSYFGYIVKTFWPFDLAAIYPHPRDALPAWQVAAAGFALVVLTVVALRMARRFPYLVVGWFWYLITLLPVIGLVQVGIQAMADRYTYIPLIGLFLAIAWGVPELLRHLRPRAGRATLLAAAAVVTVLLATRAWDQARHWKSGVDLFEHTVRVTENNARAHNGLGLALGAEERRADAIPHFREAMRIEPAYPDPYANLAGTLALEGRFDEALELFDRALELEPDDAACLTNLGTLLMSLGRSAESVEAFSRAIEIDPDNRSAHKNLGVILARQGNLERAAEHFSEALRIDPADEGARRNLERARATRRD